MTAKEYLSQAYRLDRRIDSKLEQLSALRETTTKATAVMNDVVVSRTRNMQSLQETIEKIVDMERELNTDIDTLVDLKREMTGFIKQVKSPQHQLILEMRYLTYKNWKDIAEALELDERYAYKLHGAALEKKKKILSSGE